MSEYVVDDWVLCAKEGHPKGGKWTHGRECPDHPPVDGNENLLVISVNKDTGTVTYRRLAAKE